MRRRVIGLSFDSWGQPHTSYLQSNYSCFPSGEIKGTSPEHLTASAVSDEYHTTGEPVNNQGRYKYLQLQCGLPVKAMPKVGQRKWGETPVTDDTIRNAEELMLLGAPNAAAQLSLYRAFIRWRLKLERETILSEALIIFAAYLDGTGLKKTTCVEYVQTAKKMARSAGETFGDPSGALEGLLKGLKIKAALEKPEHAVDVSEERINVILSVLQREDVRFVVWLMSNCGARASDLQRLESNQIRLIGDQLTILFRVTKTHREPGKAYQVTYTIKNFDPQWSEFLFRQKPVTCDADAINKVLHKAGFPETTYSFRRFFVQETIDRFTEGGHTDWCRVIELTVHDKDSTVKGHYQRHIDDLERDAHVGKDKKRARTVTVPPITVSDPKKVQLKLTDMFTKRTS